MAKQTRTYTTLRPFPHRGEVISKGDTVELHPNQVRYLLGTHLAEPKPKKTPANASKSTTTEGDQ